ncbi:hypothetical protein GH714_023334 [Hevea brasiliensis]|uniref:Uncharacterized protein n=1 Tax=Hevea brasiliensis TaxID=3981 RepID=A0A6A6M6L0_HEVBR|nr:hypothetical protein GH714_023334 [Hevea brasiliensis]
MTKAWSGHANVVNYLCKNKADVGAAAMDDMGAIHFAAQKGHLEVVRTLLSSGVSIKTSTRKGLTPLHYAAQGSNLELVKYLVKKGASLAVNTKAGKTPLDLASREEIRLFLEESEQSSKKGNVNAKEEAEESNPKPSLPDKLETASEKLLLWKIRKNRTMEIRIRGRVKKVMILRKPHPNKKAKNQT